MQMVEFLGPAINSPVKMTSMHVCIHEDNAGALFLADTLLPQYMPCSKHYHTKTIWFRELIKKLFIKLCKIATFEQLGDIFMQALPQFNGIAKFPLEREC